MEDGGPISSPTVTCCPECVAVVCTSSWWCRKGELVVASPPYNCNGLSAVGGGMSLVAGTFFSKCLTYKIPNNKNATL